MLSIIKTIFQVIDAVANGILDIILGVMSWAKPIRIILEAESEDFTVQALKDIKARE